MRFLVVSLINFYRYFISPLIPARCRFIPTCSEYALEAIERYGVWKGSYLGLKRLLRCHPFSSCHGYDPLP